MAAFKGDSIFWIETNKIVPNPYQPRRDFDEARLQELAESIRMYGVLQPLTVSRREVTDDTGSFRTEYELIAGERRLRASKLAGVEQVPVIIREGQESEQEKLELAIIENLQREDLNAVDRALAFRQLAEMFDLSHGQVAKKVGRSREYVSNSIRLLNLPDTVLNALKVGDLSEGHARTLLMLNDRPEEQDTLFREALMKKLTVRETERIARKIATDKVRKQAWKGSDPDLIEKEKQFTETLGTRVQLTKTDYGGKITIDYFSDEDLELLLQTLAQQRSQGQPETVSPVTSAAAAVGGVNDEPMLDTLTTATPLQMSDRTPDASLDASAESEPAAATQPPAAPVAPAEQGVSASTSAPPPEPAATVASSPLVPEAEAESLDAATAHSTPSATTPAAPTADSSSSLRDKLAQLFGDASDNPATDQVANPEMTETAPSSQAPVPIPASNPVSESQPAQPLAEQEEHHPAPESTDVNATPEGTNANPSPKSTTGATNTPHSPSPTHDEADLYGLRHFSI